MAASTTFVTEHLAETRSFYELHFGARASFDAGWYVVLRLGGDPNGPELCLMQPQDGAVPYSGGAMLNLTFENVDEVYEALISAGITPVIPLEDHPWGDRGFGVEDPAGTVVYCLTPIEPTEEFRGFQIDLTR
jgi:catechol 2,3-dioxygenase-like lactoylglutathione lyase family enzyme